MLPPDPDKSASNAAATAASLVGAVIADKYRVERVIGKGGIGIVVAATHLQLQETVALKFLLPDAASIAGVVARFLREARALVKIRSEHVARVLDVGAQEPMGPYMVMEHLEGRDLSAIRRERGRLPLVDVVLYVAQACQAMAEAHALGIIHRDVKPANLFLTRGTDGSDCIKVLDFGISKAAGLIPEGDVGTSTETTSLIGSPNYMAPEQMMSARTVDARADIWSLGIILYELLTGERPFKASSLPQICMRVMHDTPTSPREHAPEIPLEIENIILRCLQKDRELRYPNVAELAAAIAPFGPPEARACAERAARVLRVSAEPGASAAVETSADAPPPSKTLGSVVGVANSMPPPRSAPRSVSRFHLGAVAAVVAIGVLGAWYVRAQLSAPGVASSASEAVSASGAALAAPEPTASAVQAPPVAPESSADGPETTAATPSVSVGTPHTPGTTTAAVAPARTGRPQVGRPPKPARPAPASTPPQAPGGPKSGTILPDDRK